VIRVVVAATSPIMQVGLEAILASSPDITIAGRAASAEQLAEAIISTRPDVALADLDLHALDDLPEAGDQLASLVLLIEAPRGDLLAEALRGGRISLLPRDATSEEILVAVRAAAAGLVTLHPALALALAPLVPSTARAESPVAPSQSLTPREIEVLQMIAAGLGNKLIARRLDISEHTVKFHVASILAKLNAATRTEAVAIAARQGMIML
jgi:NarL family two-component system response regulator YdfI